MTDYHYEYRTSITIAPAPRELLHGGYNLGCWAYIDLGDRVLAKRIHIPGTEATLDKALMAIRPIAESWIDENYPAGSTY